MHYIITFFIANMSKTNFLQDDIVDLILTFYSDSHPHKDTRNTDSTY